MRGIDNLQVLTRRLLLYVYHGCTYNNTILLMNVLYSV